MSNNELSKLEKEIEELKSRVKELESGQRRSRSPVMPKQYDVKYYESELVGQEGKVVNIKVK